jgi:hypothetical protein
MSTQTGSGFDFGPGGIWGTPKKRKQNGGSFLEWLVPPLAVAKLARQEKQKRRRQQQQRRRQHQAKMQELQQDSGYQSRRRQANLPPLRQSRNFYISVNNSLNNRRRPQNNTLNNQRRPQRGFANSQAGGIVASREQQERWLREYKLQQRGGSWWPDWIAPRPKKIVHPTRAEDRWTKKYHSAKSPKYKPKQKGGSGLIRGGTEARQKKQISWVKRQFGGGFNYKNDKKAAGKTADNLVSWMSKIQ